jgi:mgtE-like transporter
MESQDSKGKIVRQTFPSEIISIVGDILAGIILTVLILPFKSFILLILIIPALLSLRGNLSGPFIARTSRDLIIGEFSKWNLLQSIFATFSLSIATASLIGIATIFLNLFLIKLTIISIFTLLGIPLLSILITLTISIPTSIILNLLAFRLGIDPNNVVNPIMTAIDDFFTVFAFYITLIMLGVP